MLGIIYLTISKLYLFSQVKLTVLLAHTHTHAHFIQKISLVAAYQ